MKIIHLLNIIIFSINVVAYIFEPILGLLIQIGLGLFQIIFAIRMTLEKGKLKTKTRNILSFYWKSILTWMIVAFTFLMVLESRFLTVLFLMICPMLIGLIFVIVTYSSQSK